jgi:monovalent cation/hydrogen antiporter
VLAFVLIGLQLRGVLSRMEGHDWSAYLKCAGAACAAAVLVRIVWGPVFAGALRWKRMRFGPRDPALMPTYKNAVLASWCGMRGIVTLAAALALPDGPDGFPFRDIIVFSAFAVVLFTLVLQGLSLPPLMRLLGLHDDGSVDREIAFARAETARAALRSLAESGGDSVAAALLRSEYHARLREEEAAGSGRAAQGGDLPKLQRMAVRAQRGSLRDLRARDVIGDDAFHAVEAETDLLELTAETRIPPRPEG